MLIIAVTFTVDRAHQGAFREAIVANAKTSLEVEDGCLRFDVCERAQEAVFFLYEQYTDDDAFAAHLRSAHFLEFDKLSAPWILNKQVERYHLVV